MGNITTSIADEFDDITVSEDDGFDPNAETIEINDGESGVGVSKFDIAGAILGMTFEEIQNLYFNNSSLYAPISKDSIIYTINKDWKYNFDYECRQNNVFVPEDLKKCIYSLAKNRGQLYASEVHLFREYTGETIDIYFTSNYTDNVVWRIVYKNDVNKLDGPAEKFANQREKKILAFWQGVLDKYGTPNSGTDKWVSSTSAYEPMMTAYYGELELIDRGIHTVDSSKNIQSARENFQAKPYAF
ncbi:MAG: hypothetical protein MJ158_02845 [Alphaproteobacteria bacterium]|nr:hypothetical protein [Alphaproteobacteria bacterium]